MLLHSLRGTSVRHSCSPRQQAPKFATHSSTSSKSSQGSNQKMPAAAFTVAFRDRVLTGLAKAARAVIFHAPRDIAAGGVWTGKLPTRPPAVVLIEPAIRSVEAACRRRNHTLECISTGQVWLRKIATGIEAVKFVGLKTFHTVEAARPYATQSGASVVQLLLSP